MKGLLAPPTVEGPVTHRLSRPHLRAVAGVCTGLSPPLTYLCTHRARGRSCGYFLIIGHHPSCTPGPRSRQSAPMGSDLQRQQWRSCWWHQRQWWHTQAGWPQLSGKCWLSSKISEKSEQASLKGRLPLWPPNQDIYSCLFLVFVDPWSLEPHKVYLALSSDKSSSSI